MAVWPVQKAITSVAMKLPASLLAIAILTTISASANPVAPGAELWTRENLFVSNFVPFGNPPLEPTERAEMLVRLGIRKYVYSFRDRHLEQFDEEVTTARRHGLEIIGWLLTSRMKTEVRERVFEVIARHGIHPQLWVIGVGGEPTDLAQDALVAREADQLQSFVESARRLGCQLGLYNHGGWFGRPANQLAIIAELKRRGFDGVGMVYNFHHAHRELVELPKEWPRMRPHVIAINLNGLVVDGDRKKKTILPLGQGEMELPLMRMIQESGWRGPVGLIAHRNDEPQEATLARNLAGFLRLADQLRTGTRP